VLSCANVTPASMEQALRYREVGVWRQFVQAPNPTTVTSAGPLTATTARQPIIERPSAEDEASPTDQDGS